MRANFTRGNLLIRKGGTVLILSFQRYAYIENVEIIVESIV